MGVKYEREVAKNLISDIERGLANLESVGDNLIKVKNNCFGNDAQSKNCINAIDYELKMVGIAVRDQYNYKQDFIKHIRELENN